MEYEHVDIEGDIIFENEIDYLRCRMSYLFRVNLASLNISFMEYVRHIRDNGNASKIMSILTKNRYETICNFSYSTNIDDTTFTSEEYVINLNGDLDNASLYIDAQDTQNIQEEVSETVVENIIKHDKRVFKEIKGTIFDKIDLD